MKNAGLEWGLSFETVKDEKEYSMNLFEVLGKTSDGHS